MRSRAYGGATLTVKLNLLGYSQSGMDAHHIKPKNKTCKELWIDIQNNLKEKWKELLTRLYKIQILFEINVFYTNIQ